MMNNGRHISALRLAMTAISGQPPSPTPAYGKSGNRLGSGIRAGLALLALTPVAGQALGLGEITVRSTLGQPLNASVPLQLGPGESLAGECVKAGKGSGSGLRNVPEALVATPQTSRAGEYSLSISTAGTLQEPMYELSLVVNCPGAPVLVRQYVLMLDLPGTSVAAVAAVQARAVPAAEPAPAGPTREEQAAGEAPGQARPVAARRARQAAGAARTPVPAGAHYRVVAGDTLSSIAARVSARGNGLWVMADRIFKANPDAFIRSNPDLIKLGSEIVIPGLEAPVVSATSATPPVPAPTAAVDAAPPALSPEPAPLDRVAPAEEIVGAAAPASAPGEQAPPPLASLDSGPRPLTTPARKSVPATSAEPRPDMENSGGVSPLLATITGVGFGLLISSLLWSRRIREIVRGTRPASPAVRTRVPDRSLATDVTADPAPIRTGSRRLEPAITVSYTAADEDTLAEEFAVNPRANAAPGAETLPGHSPVADLTSELADMFSREGRTGETTNQQVALPASRAASNAGVDVLLGDDDETRMEDRSVETGSWISPTIQTSAVRNNATSASGTFDIHALAGSADGDTRQAQTLMEALTMLERDYEEELTASQVIDMSAIRDALATEDTAIRKDRSKKSG